MRLRRILGLVKEYERDEDSDEERAAPPRNRRASSSVEFTSNDDEFTSESDKSLDGSTSDDDASTLSDGGGSASEGAIANTVSGSTLVVHLHRVVIVGTASYCYTAPFWSGAALSWIPSFQKLQWYRLWPSDTFPTDVTFLVDGSSREYHLYQSALRILRTEFPQPNFDDDHYGMMLQERIYSSPMTKHESWGVLVNLLGDRYCMHWPMEDTTAEIHETLSLSSTLDFILSGMLHMFSLTRHYGTSNPPTALAALRRHHPGRDFEQFAYEAIFFDLMYQLWRTECMMRHNTKVSPMPWSEYSSQETSGPTCTSSLFCPLSPSFVMPSAEAWSAWDAQDAMNIRWMKMEFVSLRTGFPPDIPWFGAPHDGYPLASTLSSYVTYRRSGSTYGHGLKEDFALWLSALTFGVLEIITGMHVPEATLVVSAGGSEVLSGTRLLRFMCLSTRDPAVDSSNDVVARATDNVTRTLDQALMALVEEGTSVLSSLILRSDVVRHPGDRELILGPVYLTMISVHHFAARLWPQLPMEEQLTGLGHLPIETHRVPLTWALQSSILSMRRAGWCPSVISAQALTPFYRETALLSRVARLKPYIKNTPDEHHNCTDMSCIHSSVNPKTYVIRHVDPSCHCEFIKPTPGAVEENLSANHIPVIVYDGAQITVRRSSSGPYVAISHVWADGLGSVTQDGLPTCQVARLSRLVTPTISKQPSALWIDSLCVPRREPHHPFDLRGRAITLMSKTYEEAASVLVIDSTIRTQCSTSTPMWHYLFRIGTSGWMQRVWTLQEGLLAQRLYFEFIDRVVDVDEHLATLKGVVQRVGEGALQQAEKRAALDQYLLDHGVVESLPGSDEALHVLLSRAVTPEESRLLVSLFGYRERARISGTPATLEDVIILLRGRSTSHEEDETIAIAGLFPRKVNVQALLDIKDPSDSSAMSQRRMEEFLKQIGEVPRELPWLSLSDRLSRPNFRWAPATLANVGHRSFSGAAWFGTATCTADGLLGKYVLGRFLPAILVPITDNTPSPDDLLKFSFRLAHEGHAYDASLEVGRQALSGLRYVDKDGLRHVAIDSILLQDDPLPQQTSNWKHFAAAQVIEGGGDGGDERVPIHCTFVTSGRIEPMPPLLAEAILASKTMTVYRMQEVSQIHVLLK